MMAVPPEDMPQVGELASGRLFLVPLLRAEEQPVVLTALLKSG
jgi:hypothetical protein